MPYASIFPLVTARAVARAFTYEVPAALADQVRPGARVVCGFGSRRLVGVVLGVAERPLPGGSVKVKPIAAVIDPEPVLPEELLGFLVQLA